MQANTEKHFELLTKRLQESLFANVRSVVKEEVERAMADGQQALNDTVLKVLRSQAPTPVPMASQQQDRQQIMSEIDRFLNVAQFNMAFQHVSFNFRIRFKKLHVSFFQALQAKDMAVLAHACQRVDPSRLFSENTTHPLQQPVILSLLHQLATDLATSTDLKLRWMLF